MSYLVLQVEYWAIGILAQASEVENEVGYTETGRGGQLDYPCTLRKQNVDPHLMQRREASAFGDQFFVR